MGNTLQEMVRRFSTPVSDYDRRVTYFEARTPRSVLPGDPRHDPASVERAEHAAALGARDAEQERSQRVQERVAEAERAMPSAFDLACDISGLSPARAALVVHLAWIWRAERDAEVSRWRLAQFQDASECHAEANRRLAALEEQTRHDFGDWLRSGSLGDRPALPLSERDDLRLRLEETETEAGLLPMAEFEAAVSDAVVISLEERLPALRAAILAEAASPIMDQIAQAARAMRDAYGALAALATVAEVKGLRRKYDMKFPGLADGSTFEVDGAEEPAAIAHWTAALSAVAQDPRAAISLPGTLPPTSPSPCGGTKRRIMRLIGK